ncbi:uncharacterized protein LOC121711846 isoform X2 [Alosa sapidissima]|uniref:uncharacterized protein LOC121711846 isoform X2 n=1 Tax=Alosa sapidissima TaxID=34773 RepID=UPI001C09AF1F|nr:uncharacterized protein LOC121711846 isoform X2 [Alosa sapidissima]
MEVRGDHGCFMQAMRVCLATIRDRIRQRRTRQRTKNYRTCQNFAVAKTDSEKGRKGKKSLDSGLNTRAYKPNHSAKVAPANVDTTQGRRQQEDGAPGKLQDRMKASLQAFEERRKPYWVLQREKNMDDINREASQARGDLQPGEPATEKVNMEDTEAGEDLQPDEPASWVVTNAQMWQKMAQDGRVVYTMPIMNFEGFLVTRAGEGLQADEQDFQSDEPASWIVANGQMWENMAQ